MIRYRLRQREPGPLQLMLLMIRMNGNYGGNFEYHIPASELCPGPDGWCEIAIPISR